jgi:hypothetical protein
LMGRDRLCGLADKPAFQHFQASNIIGGTAVAGLNILDSIFSNLIKGDGPAPKQMAVITATWQREFCPLPKDTDGI